MLAGGRRRQAFPTASSPSLCSFLPKVLRHLRLNLRCSYGPLILRQMPAVEVLGDHPGERVFAIFPLGELRLDPSQLEGFETVSTVEDFPIQENDFFVEGVRLD